MSRGIQELLGALQTSDATAVTIGRIPAVSRSASLEIAAAHAKELLENPKYYARCGPIEMVIDWSEYAMLQNHGARTDGKPL